MMKECTGFWAGMCAGLAVGAAIGIMVSCRRNSMKTPVGKSIEKLGMALDRAADSIISELH